MCQLLFVLLAFVEGLESCQPAKEDAALLLQLRSVQSLSGNETAAAAPGPSAALNATAAGGPESSSSALEAAAAANAESSSSALNATAAAGGSESLPPSLEAGGEAERESSMSKPKSAPRALRVIFGVQTSATPVYAAKLRAGLDSWLRDVPAADRIILGPRCAEEEKKNASSDEAGGGGGGCAETQWEASRCDDRSQLCKHLALLDRAYGTDFDWFVTLGEDHVVMADLLKASLAYLDPAVPAALASIGETPEDGGCGQLWRYSKGSKGGTKPIPAGWVEPDTVYQSPCLAVQKRGGLCGGTGIVYSRAAVDRLFADGRDAFWSRMAPFLANNTQYDTGMSCELMDRGVSLNQGCGLMTSAASLNIKTEDPESPAVVRPNLIYHVAGKEEAPSAMRMVWMQMLSNKKIVMAERRKWVSQCLSTCPVKGFCRAPSPEAQAGLLELGTTEAH